MEAAKIGPDLRLLRTKQLNWPIRTIRVFKAILVKVLQLTLTLKMTTAQVIESSVTVNNSPIQDYDRPDDHDQHTYCTDLQLLCWCDWLTSDHSLYVLFAHMATFWREQPTRGENIIKHYHDQTTSHEQLQMHSTDSNNQFNEISWVYLTSFNWMPV